jgi:hypothetical protein
MTVRLAPVSGEFEASRTVTVEAAALEQFRDAVSPLLDALSGSATLEPVLGLGDRGDFAITIELKHGKGSVSGFLAARYPESRLVFSGIETDQSYLHETRRQLQALLADS